jgi:hydroxymethylpyrimidine kinase/phosphomethylpyrimidine kinase
MVRVALTIAGSDPSGGAGIQADLKTFHQFGTYGASVITLLTVQNTLKVGEVRILDPKFVGDQLDAILEDIPPHAAKTGALGSAAIIRLIGARAARFDFPLVVDPVMISKHGAPLLAEDAWSALVEHLIPRAFLVTPNLHEAGVLAAMEVGDIVAMEKAAERIATLGARAVLVKGAILPIRRWTSYTGAARFGTSRLRGLGQSTPTAPGALIPRPSRQGSQGDRICRRPWQPLSGLSPPPSSPVQDWGRVLGRSTTTREPKSSPILESELKGAPIRGMPAIGSVTQQIRNHREVRRKWRSQSNRPGRAGLPRPIRTSVTCIVGTPGRCVS